MTQKKYRISNGMELTQSQHHSTKSVFVISDLHLDHENIIDYCKRPFDSVHEMNRVLIKNWNYVVKPDDTVYFVGDMTLGNSDRYTEKLNGNIYFIWGNHDKTEDVDSNHEFIHCTFKGIEFLFIHSPETIPEFYKGWVIHGHHHNNNPQKYPFFNPERKWVNVSVEMVKYKPIPLDFIHKLITENHEKMVYLKDDVKMGPKIVKEKIQREKGYLYFIGKDGYIWAAPMKHNKSGKKKKVGTIKHPIIKDPWIIHDQIFHDGFVAKAKMNRTYAVELV